MFLFLFKEMFPPLERHEKLRNKTECFSAPENQLFVQTFNILYDPNIIQH